MELERRVRDLERKAHQVPSNDDNTSHGGSHSDTKTRKTPTGSQLERVRSAIINTYGMLGCALYRVPEDYYQRTLHERAVLLQSPVESLCKTMIIENTLAPKDDDVPNTKDPLKSRYFAVLLQYCTKLETERLSKQLRALALETYDQEQAPPYKLKMADQQDSYRLTGYGFNAVTPFGTTYGLPLIVSRNIEAMRARNMFRFVWLGGGDVDLKLRMFMNQLLNKYQPALFVIDCTSEREDYDNEDESI
eukprot:gb/GECG01007490.1/.p1 GENE.gb/GECG01007490.1/~~gb/GECG01007490.1/.p1  ORF type:complete len:248 (+),score=29.91 gb/GECG01007490.1/:1-744(+)